MVIYHDFFEAKLDVDRAIIKAAVQAKNELKILKNGAIEFDKNMADIVGVLESLMAREFKPIVGSHSS